MAAGFVTLLTKRAVVTKHTTTHHFGGYSKTRYKRLQSLIQNHMSAVCLLEVREQIDIKAISNVLGFVSDGSVSSSSTRGEEITVDTRIGAQAASVRIKFFLNTPVQTPHPPPAPAPPPPTPSFPTGFRKPPSAACFASGGVKWNNR